MARRRSSGERSSGGSSSSASANNAFEVSLGQQLHSNQSKEQNSFRCFISALSRKKPLDCRTDTSLNRCLNLVDLTALGVGSTLGLGLYVLAGQVASNKAGPAVVISFLFAAIASAFSALCYAEFAGRVPRAGSAYAYSYISVGEFVAFIIGWNLVLEYVIGASSVARGFSGYLRFVYEHVANSLANNQQSLGHVEHFNSTLSASSTLTSNITRIVSNYSTTTPLPEPVEANLLTSIEDYLIEYFDWPSVVIITLLTIFILFGVKESTNVTIAFTSVNLLVVVAVFISSISQWDLHNWRLTKSEVPAGFGEGGFMPYGWSGILKGSATCFFGFIGFDTIASSAEEAKNPKRNVPISIVLSLLISFVAYMAIAVVQTLMWPYYDQNKVTILPYIFGCLDMPITYWVVLLGAIAGLASSQLGGMYPLPRILYSMATDKLIYASLAKVNPKLKLPVRATIVGSIFVALLACLLDIEDLADMVSIGTLAAYSLVSLSVLILRYEDRSDAVDDSTILSNHLTFTDILNNTELSTGRQTQNEGSSLDKSSNHREYDAADDNKEVDGCKPKLATKSSSPIHENGSKAVVAQLSVGFHSWFDRDGQDDASITTTVSGKNKASATNPKKLSYLNLLVSWKADDLQSQTPNDETSRKSKILISIIVILSIILDVVALMLSNSSSPTSHSNYPPSSSSSSSSLIGSLLSSQQVIEPELVLLSVGCIVVVLLATVMLMLMRLPTSRSMNSEMFQVPLVPLIPTLSIFVNTFLMLNLSYLTWVRFTVWMTVGFFIYFTYGIWNSEGYLLYLDR